MNTEERTDVPAVLTLLHTPCGVQGSEVSLTNGTPCCLANCCDFQKCDSRALRGETHTSLTFTESRDVKLTASLFSSRPSTITAATVCVVRQRTVVARSGEMSSASRTSSERHRGTVYLTPPRVKQVHGGVSGLQNNGWLTWSKMAGMGRKYLANVCQLSRRLG